MVKFDKYVAAGNTYIVTHLEDNIISSDLAKRLCHPIFGIGADGVVNWQSQMDDFSVLIFNPDGSLAEKSGNGLRILATHLFKYHEYHAAHQSSIKLCVANNADNIEDSIVKASKTQGNEIVLEMGEVVSLFKREPLVNSPIFPHGIELKLSGRTINGYPVSIGNPHFVIITDRIEPDIVKKIGPEIETHSAFPNRTNVQFVTPVSPHKAKASIWERGAGYTLSSGSSSCAIFAVLHQLGLCADKLTVVTEGGELNIQRDPSNKLWLRGAVKKVAEGLFLG